MRFISARDLRLKRFSHPSNLKSLNSNRAPASPYVLVFEHACFHSLFGYIFAYQDVSQYTQNEQKAMLYFEQ